MGSAWDWFQEQAAAIGVPVSDAQCELFRRYHALLVETNRTTNLTRIVDERDAILKHYLDSLLFLKVVPEAWNEQSIRFADIGTGPGIPGIPLLIMRPHWTGLLVDSVGKKVAFMQHVAETLGLSGANPIHGRAEDLGHDPDLRESCDAGFARALAALPTLLEYVLPFVRPQGQLIVSKGTKGPEELAASAAALKQLKGKLVGQTRLELPEGAGERHLYVIEKTGPLGKSYPRKAGIPHRKPIC